MADFPKDLEIPILTIYPIRNKKVRICILGSFEISEGLIQTD
jgi:hypothetical protein